MTWTLDELVGRAAQALADVRVGNGRVTGVPDGRLVRWYATIGLVDRPLPGPGRGARYGPRHLLQLVAVKRLQAQGYPLVEIQERLTGATDATLRTIADLPSSFELEPVAASPSAAAPAERFWKAGPAPYVPATPLPPPPPTEPVGLLHGVRVGDVTLLLPAVPSAADLDAIATAARPLLDLLAARGLITPPPEGDPS